VRCQDASLPYQQLYEHSKKEQKEGLVQATRGKEEKCFHGKLP
jgi:hypothetical protein